MGVCGGTRVPRDCNDFEYANSVKRVEIDYSIETVAMVPQRPSLRKPDQVYSISRLNFSLPTI